MKAINLIISVVVFSIAFFFTSGTVQAANEADLCGGTGGNGQIVSVEKNTFTLKLNEGGQKGGGNLIVTLRDGGAIETQTGNVSVSELKIGDRITLVGDNNRDGTFTADAVVVCSTSQETKTGERTSITVRNNDDNYEKVNGTINIVTFLIVGLVWVFISAFLLKRKKGFVYVLFFTIFYIYLYKVLDYTLLQFQSLLLLQHFLPNLMLSGVEEGKNVNLIPLISLTFEDVQTSLLNILMMTPFGFGLPFITNFRFKWTVISGLLLSITIEFLQLITGFMANTTFRVADINDLVFNTIGVAIGYMLFVGFVRNYRNLSRNWKRSNPILKYIAERPQVDKSSSS